MFSSRSVLPSLFLILAVALFVGVPHADARRQGPPPCDSTADCQERCPAEFLGCTCAETPRGDSICVPTCNSDEDCPDHDRGPSLVCDVDQAICVPDRASGERGGERGSERGSERRGERRGERR